MEIFNQVFNKNYDYTLFNIGSSPRTLKLDEFTPDVDQLLPVFMLDILKNTQKSFYIVHVDPAFNYPGVPEFLNTYFTSKGFHKDGGWISSDGRVEVKIIPELFSFVTHTSIIHQLIMQTITNPIKLIVQQYSGPELLPEFEKFLNSEFRDIILKNVLFDITYGADCHCMTPLTQHAPIFDKNADFCNLAFYDEAHSIELIGIDKRIDKLIRIRILKRFSQILNDNHVNYRKALNGDTHLFPSSLYSGKETPDKIMEILLKELSGYMRVLDKLDWLTPEKKQIFSEYSTNYKSIDVYKWYSEMSKIYR